MQNFTVHAFTVDFTRDSTEIFYDIDRKRHGGKFFNQWTWLRFKETMYSLCKNNPTIRNYIQLWGEDENKPYLKIALNIQRISDTEKEMGFLTIGEISTYLKYQATLTSHDNRQYQDMLILLLWGRCFVNDKDTTGTINCVLN